MDETPTINDRPLFFYWLLGFATFGLSLPFYFCFAVSKIKKINQSERTPWLWFPVPLLPVFQFFALPALVNDIENAEQKLGIKPWSHAKNIAYIASTILATFLSGLSTSFDYPVFWQFCLLFAWVVTILSIAPRIYRLVAKSDIQGPKRYAMYSVIEWPFVLLGLPFLLFVLWFSGLNIYIQGNALLDNRYHYVDDKKRYGLHLFGNTWREADIGTYSDGSALVEFSGFDFSASLIVFEHANQTDITSVAQWRISESNELLSDADCTETRAFLPGSIYLEVFVECEGTLLGEQSIYMYKFIQIDEADFIELYGNYTANKDLYKKNISQFRQTMQSLQPQKSEAELNTERL